MKKVLILFGGNSFEHYISCKSAKSIIENIDKKSFKYEICGIDFNNNWFKFNDDLSYLDNGNWLDGNILKIDNIIGYLKCFDVVFPITHGNNGEDGNLQGMLDLFNIRYVGSKTTCSVLSFNKALSKLIFNSLNIPQVPYVLIDNNFKVSNIIKKLNFPMIVKPSCGGSSIGISKANNKKELIKGIKDSLKYDKCVIVEKFIEARELECAILGYKDIICSIPGEINSCNDFYDYNAKYVQKSETKIADIPDSISFKIREYAMKIFEEIGAKDFARIDFFYNDDGIFINEINTIPGFTDISMYPILMAHENISYKELISILINNA